MKFRIRLALISLLTLLAFAVMGYHPGYEDDEVYLTAVKSALHPALYPHDADFFRLQMQASLFDSAMAWLVNHGPFSLENILFAVQFLSLGLILCAAYFISREIFSSAAAQWSAVAMLGAMLTLPVAGTALLIADQHLHPRNLATGLILAALAALLKGKRWLPAPLLAAAMLLHPIMGAFGVSLCVILALVRARKSLFGLRLAAAPAALPIGWLVAPPDANWRLALETRHYYFLTNWAWYEWLGALAPLLLFWLLARWAGRSGNRKLKQTALALLVFGIFQQACAMLILAPQALERMRPLQPMRYLQLEYVLLALIGGGLIGQFLLKASLWRWALYLLLINGGMFAAQYALFDGAQHLEMPWSRPANPWTEAFAWIREHTPPDAYFALDPEYMARPGEGYHGFRALAERSRLSDSIKDSAVVTQVPLLSQNWHKQQVALAGWRNFTVADFQGLKARFGVDWVLVENPQQAGLNCSWHNRTLSVCQIP